MVSSPVKSITKEDPKMIDDKAKLEHIESIWRQASCICSDQQVVRAIDLLADRIAQDLEMLNPLVICIMNGGMIFASKLLLRLPFILQVDYLHATRYQEKTKGAELKWVAKPQYPLADRHILLVDDILDEGHTLLEVKAFLKQAEVASIKTAVLVDKQHNRKAEPNLTADYAALELEDKYLFGYGMDYLGFLRNVNGIYAVSNE